MRNNNLIYMPKGKAGEYSYYGCNIFKGCSNKCSYCYCKKGKLKDSIGMDKPILRSIFPNIDSAIKGFEKNLNDNLFDLQKHGIFFSFATDPMLDETYDSTFRAMSIATLKSVPIKILTKSVGNLKYIANYDINKSLVAIGVTLTGHDELEPFASKNSERIKVLKEFYDSGYKTFTSIEPIIDFRSSFKMIEQTIGYCDLYMIGLEDERKYNKNELIEFIFAVRDLIKPHPNIKVYWKDSINQLFPIRSKNLKHPQIVGANYNLFRNQ